MNSPRRYNSGFGKGMNSVHFHRGFNGLHTEIWGCRQGTTWLSITVPSSEDLLNPWKRGIALHMHRGLHKTPSWPLFHCFPAQGWLHHPTGSRARIKSCSFYHLNIFHFHSPVCSTTTITTWTGLYRLSTQLLQWPPNLSTCSYSVPL